MIPYFIQVGACVNHAISYTFDMFTNGCIKGSSDSNHSSQIRIS